MASSILLITPSATVTDRILSHLPAKYLAKSSATVTTATVTTATVTTATISLGSYIKNAKREPYITSLVPQFLALPTPPTLIFLAGPVEPCVLELVKELHKSETDTLHKMKEAERRDAAERAVDEFGNNRRITNPVDESADANDTLPSTTFHVLQPIEPHTTMAEEIAEYVVSLKAGSPRSDIGPERFARYLATLIAPNPAPLPPTPPAPPAPAPPTQTPPAPPPSHFYRCRSCRHPLFLPSALVDHPACSSPPFTPPDAILPGYETMQGALKCPKCTKPFGAFNHHGLKCACNKFLTEGMIFTVSRVDPPLPDTVKLTGAKLQVTQAKSAQEMGAWKGHGRDKEKKELNMRDKELNKERGQQRDLGFRSMRSTPKATINSMVKK